jgi:hypothetical protein
MRRTEESPEDPACMRADELEDWWKLNRSAVNMRVKSPCRDCTLAFALEMRTVGLCNGAPGEQADEEEEVA